MSKIPYAKREDGTSLYRPYNFAQKITGCTNQQKCYLPKEGGKIRFQYTPQSELIWLPCKSCVWCRKQYSAEWAMRCQHESRYHAANCFITLTYSPENLPFTKDGDQTLRKSDLQKFLKRLRKELSKDDIKIRYFASGEYGDKLGRPHYHAIIFGTDFPDKRKLPSTRRAAFPLYTSETLNKTWGLGHAAIADFCFESAAYVAGYVAKKVTGKRAPKHYNGRETEFCTMSRGRSSVNRETGEYIPAGGLGYEFFCEFNHDFYKRDHVGIRTSDGNVIRRGVPAYYDRLLKRVSEERYTATKAARRSRYDELVNSGDRPSAFDYLMNFDPEALKRVESARVALLRNQLRKFENA